jgi:hypothetical protein
LAVSELTGAYLESDGNNESVGDDGKSDGDFMINRPGVAGGPNPGITVAEAKDPDAATAYMEKNYDAALKVVPASTWATDPVLAAEEVADNAERPAKPYIVTQGQERVNNAVQKAIQDVKEYGMSINFGS